MDRVLYQGDGIGLVDDKGRVAIPAGLRSALAANAPKEGGKTGGTIIVGPHRDPAVRCLMAYDPGYLALLLDQANRDEAALAAAGQPFDHNIKRRAAAGEAVPFDGSGRFIMPEFPRFYAGIGEHAFFYGNLDAIEIWEPRALLANEAVAGNVREACAYYMQKKGIAL